MWPNIIIGVLALIVALGLGRFVYTPMIPIMIEQSQLSVQSAGLIASVNYIGYMLGALTPLFWNGEGVRLKAFRLGLILTLFGFALMSIPVDDALQFYVWSLARFINGVGSAWIFINMSSMALQRLSDSGHLSLAGWLYTGIGLGALLGTAIVGYLSELGFSWVQLWQFIVVMTLFLVVPIWWLVDEPEDKKIGMRVVSTHSRLSDVNAPIVWCLALAYACKGFSYIIVLTFLPLMSNGLTGVAEYSWYFLLIFSIPSAVTWGWLSARYGNILCLQVAYILQIIGVLAPVIVAGNIGILICAVFVGATFMGIVTMSLAQAQRIRPASSTMTMALITGVYSVGQFVGPGFAGWIAQQTGSFKLALMMAGWLLIIAVFLLSNVNRLYLRETA